MYLKKRGINLFNYIMKTRIKEFRARKNLSQSELARESGVARETVGLIERSQFNPSLLLAHRLAHALGTTLDETFQFTPGDLLWKRKTTKRRRTTKKSSAPKRTRKKKLTKKQRADLKIHNNITSELSRNMFRI